MKTVPVMFVRRRLQRFVAQPGFRQALELIGLHCEHGASEDGTCLPHGESMIVR